MQVGVPHHEPSDGFSGMVSDMEMREMREGSQMKKRYPPRGAEFVDPVSEVARPIFGVDIDGTLGLYHEHFHRFAEAWLGRSLPHPSQYRGGSFAGYLGISKTVYRKIKLAYRRGGAKRSMPCVDGASDLTRSLRSRGALVVLCTTRPYLSLEGVDEDTRHWCARNKIAFDFIVWGETKYRDLSRFGSRVVSVMDDEPLLLKQASGVGLQTVGIARPYNTDGEADLWAEDLTEAGHLLNIHLDAWERKNR